MRTANQESKRGRRILAEDQRDQYQDYVQGRLKEFDYRFDGLEARMKGLNKADQERLKTDIAELRDRKEGLERKFTDLKRVSDESWLDVRSSLERELNELDTAYNLVAANNHGYYRPPVDPGPPLVR